jgi:tRNA A37 methylthiotransferase MiaB
MTTNTVDTLPAGLSGGYSAWVELTKGCTEKCDFCGHAPERG